MLAPRELDPAHASWNAAEHAPYGRRIPWLGYRANLHGWNRRGVRYRGPFAFQTNNSIRRHEYPWVYEQVNALGAGLAIADVGAGLAGLQFVLARQGHHVLNIDPGLEASGVGFELDGDKHRQIGKWLGAPVRRIARPIQDADLTDDALDVVISVSAIEHFSPVDLAEFASTVRRVLKPGGHLVLTIDLFLDLKPFTVPTTNKWGSNMNVADLLEASGADLTAGDQSELYGFAEFDPQKVLQKLSQYAVGEDYPAMAQLVVARRRL